MRVTRLVRLEREARERPYPGCGRTHRSSTDHSAPLYTDRLADGEWLELGGLLATAATPSCPRCQRYGLDIGRLTDDQKRRTLTLLRALSGSSTPVGRAST